MRYIALLRGINVGGHAKVGMGDVREVLRSLGHVNIMTYLQSGNALFDSEARDPAQLARGIESGLAAAAGLAITVMIRTPTEIAGVIEQNPFATTTIDPSRVHVAFLSEPPNWEGLSGIDPAQFEPDRFEPGRQEIYLLYPNGSHQSKLTNGFFEKRLAVRATMRNWNTVTKLLNAAGSSHTGV